MPADAIRDGLLRDDLFYRISTITIHVPPLRERMEDIQLLTDHFLKLYSKNTSGPSPASHSRPTSACFAPWPGNVRELQNVIERAVLASQRRTDRAGRLAFDNGSVRRRLRPRWPGTFRPT
jgi:transcriptional regulator with PAS, ATPase and Fis domain